MTYHPLFVLQPIHNSSTDILRCFATGKPLSSEQVNFLEWHEKEISDNKLDPIIKYYLESIKKHKDKFHTSFLLPHEIINEENIKELKERILFFIKEKNSNIAIRFTQKQFVQFRAVNHEIIWYSPQHMLYSQFFPNITPPILYFQWGKTFGIVKFVVMSHSKPLVMDVVVYLNDMHERTLEQCVNEHQHSMEKEIHVQQNIIHEHTEKHAAKQTEKEPETLVKTPRLTLNHYYLIEPIK